MKLKLFIAAAFTSFLSFNSFAQEAVSVSETSADINDASGNALRTEINRASPKTIAKEWKSLMKDYDGDVSIKGDEILSEEVMIDAISGRGLTVFAKTDKLSETKQEFLVIFLNGDLAISSNNDVAGYTAANLIVKEFATKVSKEATKKYNESQISLLEELNEKMEELKKEKENAEEEIEEANKEIEEAKEKINDNEYKLEDNKKKQAEMAKKIEEQKETVKNAKGEVELFD